MDSLQALEKIRIDLTGYLIEKGLLVTSTSSANIRIIQEFALHNSDIFQLCDLLLATFHNVPLMITGDATGRNRSALTKGNYNYYTHIYHVYMVINITISY